MNSDMRRKQSGFTLVEIAIVLVIIGLLLGGILKGQELINSARVRNMADMNAGIQAAYYGFIDRFRRVPGDWSAEPASALRLSRTSARCRALWARHLPASGFQILRTG